MKHFYNSRKEKVVFLSKAFTSITNSLDKKTISTITSGLQTRSRAHIYYSSLICCSFIPLFFFSSCEQELPDLQEVAPVSVELIKVEQKEIREAIQVSGLLTSQDQLNLSFKIGGVIEMVNVREGDYVKKGQKLAQLNLSEVASKKLQAEYVLKQANLALNKAQEDYKLASTLAVEGIIVKGKAKDAKLALDNARYNVQLAQSNLDIVEFNYNHSIIYAPNDGKILKRVFEPKELIGPGMPVYIFATGRNNWFVQVGVAARDIVNIKEGDTANITFDAYPSEPYQAIVYNIPAALDPKSGTYQIELKLKNKSRKRLIHGFVASGKISSKKSLNYTLIPVEALTEANGAEAFVYTVDNQDKAKRHRVKLGKIFDDKVAVTSGLIQGMQVISSGVNYIYEGANVVEKETPMAGGEGG